MDKADTMLLRELASREGRRRFLQELDIAAFVEGKTGPEFNLEAFPIVAWGMHPTMRDFVPNWCRKARSERWAYQGMSNLLDFLVSKGESIPPSYRHSRGTDWQEPSKNLQQGLTDRAFRLETSVWRGCR